MLTGLGFSSEVILGNWKSAPSKALTSLVGWFLGNWKASLHCDTLIENALSGGISLSDGKEPPRL